MVEKMQKVLDVVMISVRLISTSERNRSKYIMKNDNTYNGWSNYATWRINLEMFTDWDNGKVTTDCLEEFAVSLIEEGSENNSLARGYALGFINDVNWDEIAEAINENN